jgi:D-serine deaminase-like pyridoxal phosphate-dependent protein
MTAARDHLARLAQLYGSEARPPALLNLEADGRAVRVTLDAPGGRTETVRIASADDRRLEVLLEADRCRVLLALAVAVTKAAP